MIPRRKQRRWIKLSMCSRRDILWLNILMVVVRRVSLCIYRWVRNFYVGNLWTKMMRKGWKFVIFLMLLEMGRDFCKRRIIGLKTLTAALEWSPRIEFWFCKRLILWNANFLRKIFRGQLNIAGKWVWIICILSSDSSDIFSFYSWLQNINEQNDGNLEKEK